MSDTADLLAYRDAALARLGPNGTYASGVGIPVDPGDLLAMCQRLLAAGDRERALEAADPVYGDYGCGICGDTGDDTLRCVGCHATTPQWVDVPEADRTWPGERQRLHDGEFPHEPSCPWRLARAVHAPQEPGQ